MWFLIQLCYGTSDRGIVNRKYVINVGVRFKVDRGDLKLRVKKRLSEGGVHVDVSLRRRADEPTSALGMAVLITSLVQEANS
jgi:hypothetical protein